MQYMQISDNIALMLPMLLKNPPDPVSALKEQHRFGSTYQTLVEIREIMNQQIDRYLILRQRILESVGGTA
jgi:hypothetical protein